MSEPTWTIYPDGERGHRITRIGERLDATRRADETVEAFERRLAHGRMDELIFDWIADISGDGDPDAAEAPVLTVRQYRSDANELIIGHLGGQWLTDCTLAVYKKWATKVIKEHHVDRFAAAAARTLNSCLTWAHDNGRWPSDHAAFGGTDARKAVVHRRRRAKSAPTNPHGRDDLVSLEDCPLFEEAAAFGMCLGDAAVERWGEQARPLGRFPEVEYLTGTRVAECFALHTRHFKLRSESAHVKWQIDRSKAWTKPNLADLSRFGPPRVLAKTGLPNGHPVQLWEWGIEILAGIVAVADEHYGGWLFAACLPQYARPLDEFERFYREVRNRKDVAYPFTSHWHRHAYASYNLASEMQGGYERSVDDVADWLGDHPDTIRRTYAHGGRKRQSGWSAHRPGATRKN